MCRLREFAKKTDVVFHLAGVNRGTEEEITAGNILWTYRLAEACKSVKPSPRVIFASSSHIYRPMNRPLKETDKPKPESLYGFAKLSSEEILRASGLNCTILRLSNVYGPGCRPYYNSVIATFCHRALTKELLTINGDGSQGRDFVYVDDVVRAFLLAGQQQSKTKTFNVSSGKIISLKNVLTQINNQFPSLQAEYRKDADMG